MGALVERVARWLDRIRDLGWTLGPTRFSLIALAVVGLGLACTDQMQDVLLGLSQDINPVAWIGFYLALAWWAFNVFYGARFILDRALRPLPKRPDAVASRERIACYVTEVPRWLGTAAFGVVAIAFLRTQAYVFAAATVAVGGVFSYLFFWCRRAFLQWLYTTTGRRIFAAPPPAAYVHEEAAGLTDESNAVRRALMRRGLRGLPALAWIFIVLNALLSGALFVFVCIDPVDAGRQFGAVNFVFLATASWVAIGTGAIYFAEWSRLPVLVLLTVYVALVSPLTDNHAVRALDGDLPTGTSLGEAFAHWTGLPPSAAPRVSDPPLVVVATEGGGIRAAYWTAFLLARIQEDEPTFRDNLFAISSVSGGTIGSAVFDALLRLDDGERRCTRYDRKRISLQYTAQPVAGYVDCAEAVLGQDLLSGTIGSLLYPDLAQRFVPVPVLPDRAQAFETSLAAAWRRAVPGAARLLSGPFAAFDSGGARRHPVLLFNGTSVNTGQRVIVSNVQITSDIFPDAVDFFAQFRRPVSVATAAYTSARFPYIGPGGTYCRDCPTGSDDRVVDGGYFENFGAGTASEVVDQLHRWGQDTRRKIVVIAISSDPALGDDEDSYVTARCPRAVGQAGSAPRFGSEVTIPPVTLYNTRTARGSMAMKQLKRRIDELGGVYVPFRLTSKDKAPLGWSLSAKARSDIAAELAPLTDRDIAAARAGGCPNGPNGVALARLLDALRLPDSGAAAWGAR